MLKSFYKSSSSCHLVSESSWKGVGPPEEGLFAAGAGSPVEGKRPVTELQVESDPTSGITAAFNNFKTELNKHFTVSGLAVEHNVIDIWLTISFHS